jgi:hypothetical protein
MVARTAALEAMKAMKAPWWAGAADASPGAVVGAALAAEGVAAAVPPLALLCISRVPPPPRPPTLRQ